MLQIYIHVFHLCIYVTHRAKWPNVTVNIFQILIYLAGRTFLFVCLASRENHSFDMDVDASIEWLQSRAGAVDARWEMGNSNWYMPRECSQSCVNDLARKWHSDFGQNCHFMLLLWVLRLNDWTRAIQFILVLVRQGLPIFMIEPSHKVTAQCSIIVVGSIDKSPWE